MGVLPILDKIAAPARIQRLSIFALGTLLLVLFLENALFPGSSITSLQRRVCISLSKICMQHLVNKALGRSLTTRILQAMGFLQAHGGTRICQHWITWQEIV